MKAVLISIQPKWCELIASGKKTVEVRKTRPKLETPFKCYIYQTKKVWTYDIYSRIASFQCKVIAEFVCDEIKEITANNLTAIYFNNPQENTCLNDFEMRKYANGNNLFLWHISDLVIYDKPKELSEFYIIDNEAIKKCEHRERVYNNPDYTNGALLLGSYVCNKYETDWCKKCKTKPITRPPQSWCFVEELKNCS